MRDKTTPRLTEGEQPSAVLTGHEFLTDREVALQARLDELEKELASLEDAPDDVHVPSGASGQSLEQQATDSLRALMDILEPPARPSPAPPPQPEEIQTPAPAILPRARTGTWRRFAAVVTLLLAIAGAIALFLLYGLPRVTEIVSRKPTATTVALSTTTNTPEPTTTVRPTRPLTTATPFPSPTIVAPVILDAPGRAKATVQAETLQIVDVSGTLRLELPLSVMADTIQIVEGMPVLQPLPPTSGAGVHRGSTPFGETGNVIIAIPPEAAPASLWQTRPGDGLVGCNSDDACHDYLVTAVDTWPLERLHQLLADWPPGDEVLLYTALDESSAWVIQAQPQHQEGTR